MPKQKGVKKELTVEWVLAEKKLIKFIEEDRSYTLADNVVPYIGKITEGVKVNTTIDGDTVIFIGKQDKGSKSDSNTSASTGDWKEWTVKGLTSSKEVIGFEEAPTKEGGKLNWYQVAEEHRGKLEGVKNGTKLKVQLGKIMTKAKTTGKMYPADAVVAIGEVSKVEEPAKAPEVSSPSYTPQASGRSTNQSIESQVSVKEASAIVRSLIESGSESVNSLEKIKKLIPELTKVCLDAIHQG